MFLLQNSLNGIITEAKVIYIFFSLYFFIAKFSSAYCKLQTVMDYDSNANVHASVIRQEGLHVYAKL